MPPKHRAASLLLEQCRDGGRRAPSPDSPPPPANKLAKAAQACKVCYGTAKRVGHRRPLCDGVLDVVPPYKEWQAHPWLPADLGSTGLPCLGHAPTFGELQKRGRASLEQCREFCALWDGLHAELSPTTTACDNC